MRAGTLPQVWLVSFLLVAQALADNPQHTWGVEHVENCWNQQECQGQLQKLRTEFRDLEEQLQIESEKAQQLQRDRDKLLRALVNEGEAPDLWSPLREFCRELLLADRTDGAAESLGSADSMPQLDELAGSGEKRKHPDYTIDHLMVQDALRDDDEFLRVGAERAHLIPRSLTRTEGGGNSREYSAKWWQGLSKKGQGPVSVLSLPKGVNRPFFHWSRGKVIEFLLAATGLVNSQVLVSQLIDELNSMAEKDGSIKDEYSREQNDALSGRPFLAGMPAMLRNMTDARGGRDYIFNPNNLSSDKSRGLNYIAAPFILHRTGLDGIGNKHLGPAVFLKWAQDDCSRSRDSPGPVQCTLKPVEFAWRGDIQTNIREGDLLMRLAFGATVSQLNDWQVHTCDTSYMTQLENDIDTELAAFIDRKEALLKEGAGTSSRKPKGDLIRKYYTRIDEVFTKLQKCLEAPYRAWSFAGSLEVSVNRVLAKRRRYCRDKLEGEGYALSQDDDDWVFSVGAEDE